MRLKYCLDLAPAAIEAKGLSEDDLVSFAPMEAIDNGLGGLSGIIEKPLIEVTSGSYNFFRDGDLLLAKVTPCFENGKKAIASDLKNGVGYATSEVFVVRPRDVEPRYLNYLFSSEQFRQPAVASMTGTGGLKRVDPDAIKNFELPISDKYRQGLIADFLDDQCGRAEALICEKQQFIDLLKEKRQALISHVVTKGTELVGSPNERHDFIEINPKFGIVPFTKYIVDKSDYRGKTPNKTDSGVFLVTAKNIKMGYIDYSASSEYIADDDYESVMSRGKPKIGDILLTTEAPLGNIALVDNEDIALAQRVIRFRIDPTHFNNTYSLYLMISDFFQNQLRKVATGITAQGIKASKLGGLKLVMPPLEEQKKIVNLIETKTNPINRLIAEVGTSIELLKEHKAALISAAVTGKIDLRDKEVA